MHQSEVNPCKDSFSILSDKQEDVTILPSSCSMCNFDVSLGTLPIVFLRNLAREPAHTEFTYAIAVI